MSVSILEALENAEYNLVENRVPGPLGEMTRKMGVDQLHNAIALLEKGYALTDQVEPLLEKFGKVEDVPEK